MCTPLQSWKNDRKKKFSEYIEKNIEEINHTPSLWEYISESWMIDINFVKKWKDKELDWDAVTENDSITEDDIRNNPDLPWSRFWKNTQSMQIERALEINSDELSIFSMYMSRDNMNIIENVKRMPDFPWNWECISINPNITEEFVVEYKGCPWNFDSLSSNKAISIEFILKTMDDYPWSKSMASNPNLNKDNLFKIFDESEVRSYSYQLTPNLGIDLRFILSTLHLGWHHIYINQRSDLTGEIIEQFPDFDWRWPIICKHSADKKYITSHPKFYRDLFQRYNKTSIIDEVMHLEPRFVLRNERVGSIDEIVEFMRKKKAVKIIETAFLQAYWSTEYKLGRKRLMAEYESFFGK